MRMLATTEQMRELDRTAIEERGIPSLELMENAADPGPINGEKPSDHE